MTPPSLRLARTREELAGELARLREGGRTVALVPTMGSMHAGHRSLVARAAELADRIALSIFVNPLQFGPGEDLDRYPRDLEGDLDRAARWGVDLVFAPSQDVMFPLGPPLVRVVPGPLGDRLCGAFRPGHFEGVLTVVARLFGLFRPEIAVFGRKDFQQGVLIGRMATDLEMDVRVEVAPLVREADGLALSSRNGYLSAEERAEAPGLARALEAADRAFRHGERDGGRLVEAVRARLEAAPRFRIQYVELVDARSLDPVREARAGDVLAAAVHLGETRLIDNLVLGSERPDPRLPPDGEA